MIILLLLSLSYYIYYITMVSWFIPMDWFCWNPHLGRCKGWLRDRHRFRLLSGGAKRRLKNHTGEVIFHGIWDWSHGKSNIFLGFVQNWWIFMDPFWFQFFGIDPFSENPQNWNWWNCSLKIEQMKKRERLESIGRWAPQM